MARFLDFGGCACNCRELVNAIVLFWHEFGDATAIAPVAVKRDPTANLETDSEMRSTVTRQNSIITVTSAPAAEAEATGNLKVGHYQNASVPIYRGTN